MSLSCLVKKIIYWSCWNRGLGLAYFLQSKMSRKMLITLAINTVIALSALNLLRLLTDPTAELQQSSIIRFHFFLLLHVVFFISLLTLLPIEDFYRQIIWAFLNFGIFTIVFVVSERAAHQAEGYNEDELLFHDQKKGDGENSYLSVYFLLYIYSIMGTALMGLFLLITEGVVCWYDRIVNRFMNDALSKISFADAAKSSQCAICLADFQDNDEEYMQVRACKHVFHEECLMEWIRHNTTCPLCRTNIFSSAGHS